jgi:hypothetical protein
MHVFLVYTFVYCAARTCNDCICVGNNVQYKCMVIGQGNRTYLIFLTLSVNKSDKVIGPAGKHVFPVGG